MKNIAYQQKAVAELTGKTIRLLNLGGHRRKIVFEAPTGEGKTVMACQTLVNLVDELKSAGSDASAHEKHNALLKYIRKNSTENELLFGEVILQKGYNWLYSKLPIENTTDTLNWDSFYPQNA